MPISLEELENTIRKVITDSLRENQMAVPSKSDNDYLTRMSQYRGIEGCCYPKPNQN